MTQPERPETEVREVRSDDPALSAEANARLTEELRAAVGADRVRVPVHTPTTHGTAHPRHAGMVQALIRYRIPLGITLVVLLVVAGIVSFSTDSLWALPVAILLHAIGTFVVVALSIQLTTQVEHAGPETTALLEEEGVADPDALLNERIGEYAAGQPQEGGARAAVDQRARLTPSAGTTAPSGGTGAVGLMPPFIVAGAVLVAGAAPIVAGEVWLWLAPAIVWPAAVIWALILRAAPDRRQGD